MARKIAGLTAKSKQDERILAEIERLNDILKNIHESKRKIAKELINNIAFMSVTLQDLQELVKSKGPIIHFEQGSQKMMVENPAQKSYNTMVNRFTTATKQLFELLPKDLVDIIPNNKQKEDVPQDKLQEFKKKYNDIH